MLSKIIDRPIATTMIALAIFIIGLISTNFLPVSLMPTVTIPQINITVENESYNAQEIEESIINPLRFNLLQLANLTDIECESRDGYGKIFLRFNYKDNIDLCFIEVNESVDKAMQLLPKETKRPIIVKASATDIPSFFLNISYTNNSDKNFHWLSNLTKEVISKRIEQIEEVALVDASGYSRMRIFIEPNYNKLYRLGVTEKILINALQENNVDLGIITIADREYRWNLNLNSKISSKHDIECIKLNINDRIFNFNELATVKEEIIEGNGLSFDSNGRTISLAIIKQSSAKMQDLKNKIADLLTELHKDYKELKFELTRDQTSLLYYSIKSLKQNIIISAILAILVLIIFMKDAKSSYIVIITIPLSIVSSLLILSIIGISINIISLSGLILGVGMMIDNSIIVIDNISQFLSRSQDKDKDSAIINATKEVFTPMLSSVLTTCSVFIPLTFISGISGALFYDQAMAITISLFISLIIAVLIIPVYSKLLYKSTHLKSSRERVFIGEIRQIYKKGLLWSFRHQKYILPLLIAIVFGIWGLYSTIDKSIMPLISSTDITLKIDWNSQLSLNENRERCISTINSVKDNLSYYEALVGSHNYILSHTTELSPTEAIIYLKANNKDNIHVIKKNISNYITKRYTDANIEFLKNNNIFNSIFKNEERQLTARIYKKDQETISLGNAKHIRDKILKEKIVEDLEPIIYKEERQLVLNLEAISHYNVNIHDVYSRILANNRYKEVFTINNGAMALPIIWSGENNYLSNIEGVQIPIDYLVEIKEKSSLKTIHSSFIGNYFPINLNIDRGKVDNTINTINKIIKEEPDYLVNYTGAYFSTKKLISQLILILTIVLLLLYFILSAQFESLIQPLIILSELIIDIFGALFFMWICGVSINIMSLIGIIVMCGIVINDSIIKIDTINRLKMQMPLLKAILVAGEKRFNPIIMTSLTTILALLPFLFKGSIGAELQFPLSIALIGGMIFGTIVSLYFIPIIYYLIYKREINTAKHEEVL